MILEYQWMNKTQVLKLHLKTLITKKGSVANLLSLSYKNNNKYKWNSSFRPLFLPKILTEITIMLI